MLSNVSSSPPVEPSRPPLSPPTRDKFGRLVGRVMPPGRPPAPAVSPPPSAGGEAAATAARADRSARMRRQISRSALAMCLASPSQRNTWHMCFRVTQSRATYAKSLTCRISYCNNYNYPSIHPSIKFISGNRAHNLRTVRHAKNTEGPEIENKTYNTTTYN